MGAGTVPVRAQLGLVLAGPLEDQSKSSRRKPAIDELLGVDCDRGDVVAVLCVKVRWRMVAEVHRDHDAVEGRDARHPNIVRRAPAEPAGAN